MVPRQDSSDKAALIPAAFITTPECPHNPRTSAAGQCLSEKSSPSIVLPKPLRYHYGHAETCLQKGQVVSPQTEAATFNADTGDAEVDRSSEKTSAVAGWHWLKRNQ